MQNIDNVATEFYLGYQTMEAAFDLINTAGQIVTPTAGGVEDITTITAGARIKV